MKRKLEYLAPYLPYSVRFKEVWRSSFNNQPDMVNIKIMSHQNINTLLCDKKRYLKSAKLILRPLSGLTEEHANNCNYSHKNFKWAIINKEVDVAIWNDLLKNHWDVFGLIESGLAIDKNTIK